MRFVFALAALVITWKLAVSVVHTGKLHGEQAAFTYMIAGIVSVFMVWFFAPASDKQPD